MFVFQKEGSLPSKCWANNCLIKLILILHESKIQIKKRKMQEIVMVLYIFRIFQNG